MKQVLALRDSRKNQRILQPLASHLDGLVDPTLRRRGFARGDIVRHWREIAGERLAKMSMPERIRWPQRPGDRDTGGTLVIRVDGAAALEIQHKTEILKDRVNAYFGYAAISSIKIVQGPVKSPPKAQARPLCPPAARDDVKAMVSGVEDAELRAALDRLGQSVHADASAIAEDAIKKS
ncbi:MAG: DciA family protein [Pseudomonadota bacterium]